MDSVTKNQWQKGYRAHKYGDPTYLSFFIMYDWGMSNLFNGKAEAFLREVLDEPERADKLVRFTKLMRKMNSEMPWYCYAIEGTENIFKFNDLKTNYRGTDDGIKIKTIETLDLMIAGLMEMYRDIAFDTERWCEVLPHNMTYFNMYIIVSESREIAGRKLNTNKNQTNDFQTEDREYTAINQEFASSNKSHFAVKLSKCTFGMDSGTAIFSDLSTSEPKIAENEIQIKYQVVETYSKQYMNEFEGPLVENKLKDIKVDSGYTPAETENETTPVSEGDKISGKEESPKQSNGDTTSVSRKGNTIERVEGFTENESREDPSIDPTGNQTLGGNVHDDDTASVSPKELIIERVEGFTENESRENPIIDPKGRLQTLGENLLDDALAELEGAAQRLKQDVLAKLLLGNVYGLNAASNIQDALAAGSLNGLRNLAVKTAQALTDDSSQNSNIGASVGDNMFPESIPEVPLKPTNNIQSPPPEKDSNLGNVNG